MTTRLLARLKLVRGWAAVCVMLWRPMMTPGRWNVSLIISDRELAAKLKHPSRCER